MVGGVLSSDEEPRTGPAWFRPTGAKAHGAAVHALFVVEERLHGSAPAFSSDELYLETVEREGETRLDDVVARGRENGVDVTPVRFRGDPYEVVPAYAHDHGVDVIVMGHHGMIAERRPHLLGCVDRASKTSAVPVVAI